MTCYVVVETNVIDAEKLSQYSKLAAPTVEQYGGKFIAKGKVEVLHGNKPYAAKAVIEFASEQQAKDWYYSDAYQALGELRDQAIESQFQLVAGI